MYVLAYAFPIASDSMYVGDYHAFLISLYLGPPHQDMFRYVWALAAALIVLGEKRERMTRLPPIKGPWLNRRVTFIFSP